MTPFAALHRPGNPLLLPNAWDHASALALAGCGFAAVATTSLGVAAAAGRPDGAGATRAETVRLARSLGPGPFLLSVDAEAGFSDDPAEVADLARELADAGAAGLNLEDARGDGLDDVTRHAAKITAVKAAAPALFVNARTDTHWLGIARDETADRLRAYEAAGADGVFVPGLTDPAGIAALLTQVTVPVNILYTVDGLSVARLGELGVARVSLGSLLFRVALTSTVDTAQAIRAGQPVTANAWSYSRVEALSAVDPLWTTGQ